MGPKSFQWENFLKFCHMQKIAGVVSGCHYDCLIALGALESWGRSCKKSWEMSTIGTYCQYKEFFEEQT